MAQSETVQSVKNALEILECLSDGHELGVSELARKIGSQKSTAHRLLATLKEAGYIRQDEHTDKYVLTLKLFTIGSSAVNDMDLNKAALPVVSRLAQTSGETVHFCTIEQGRIVYLHKIESSHALKVSMMSKIGQGTPFHCTGVGKVLLAHQDADFVGSYLRDASLEKYTDATITDPLVLASELQKIRIDGCALDREEHELGVRCVAAPIFDAQGKGVAALSVSGPSVRLNEQAVDRLKDLVKNSALEISRKLGYSGTVGRA